MSSRLYDKLLVYLNPSPSKIVPSQNFLQTIFEGENPEIDIVAVHGLNPFDRPNQAEKTWTTEGKLWLRDFLPNRFPRSRVMLFGYNSNVAFGTSTSGLSEQAANLLNRVSAKRTNCSSRPIIFICHSLGGLVVKQALSVSRSNGNYSHIVDATFGVVFFGTPHRGGNGAGVGAAAAFVARAILGSPSNTFLEALTRGSSFLAWITEEFSQLLEDLQFISFFETRPLRKTRKLVVDRGSATLGLGGHREKQIGLDADHVRICKFSRPDDPTYQQVEDNIAEMVNAAVAKKEQLDEGSKRLLDESSKRLPRNVSRVQGNKNNTVQYGRSNSSSITGNVNRTQQFGEDNESDINGGENVATQISNNCYGALEVLHRHLFELPVFPSNAECASRA